MEEDDDDYDDGIASFTPGDAISNMLQAGEVRPFRNIIKRYWTDEEVSNLSNNYL